MSESDVIRFSETTLGMFSVMTEVPVGGFRISHLLKLSEMEHKANEKHQEPWLVGPSPIGVPFEAVRKLPLAKRDLHRRFARIAPTDESILAFANRYGLLGKQVSLIDPKLQHQKVQYGESLAFWRESIADVGQLLAIWNAVTRKDSGQLGKCVHWRFPEEGRGVQVDITVTASGDRLLPDVALRAEKKEFDTNDKIREAFVSHGITSWHWSRIATAGLGFNRDDELLERWEFGDPIEPARWFVCDQLNKRMKGRVSPFIHPYQHNRIYFVPDSLLAALWLLFAIEISPHDPVPMRTCAAPGCSSMFIPNDPRQIYCETACNKRAYERRKAAANSGSH